jgi:hypothetical protein
VPENVSVALGGATGVVGAVGLSPEHPALSTASTRATLMVLMLCRAVCKRYATRRHTLTPIADLSSRQRDVSASFFEDNDVT